MKIVVLTEAEIRRCVELDLDVVAAIEDGFSRLSGGLVSLPPIMRIDIPDFKGEVDVKTAYVRGLDSFAIKIASGFFENYRLGLPSGSGMMVIMSARTGMPEAVLLDNGYLTEVRTGAAGAVTARHLARQTIETAGVIGAGSQGRYQVRGLRLVRNFRRLLVFDLAPQRAKDYAAEMAPALGIEVIHAPDVETVVRESDVVLCTTPSQSPYLHAEWLHPGLHVTAMGADAEHKQELRVEVLSRADRLVCDSKAQCFRLGELHHGLEQGAISLETPVTELGEITSGKKPGRTDDSQVTVCDLTGTGVQDTAIALLAYRRAIEKGLGMVVSV